MSPRTIREFTSPDIWPIVEAWAEVDGHYLIESSDSKRLYQSHGGLLGRYLVTEWKLEISQTGSAVRMEAWIPRLWLQSLASLFGPGSAPDEREVSTDKGPRTAINRLLHLAEQPLIAEDEHRAERHFRKGLEFRDKGKWKRAVAEFDKAISKNPNHVEARTQREYAHAELGEAAAGRTSEKATQQPSSHSPQQGERYCSSCRRFLAAGTSTCGYCGQAH